MNLWDSFDPVAYHAAEYAQLRDDDTQILALLADWFADAGIPDHAHGVDVGAGANLYPALAMLPHCRRITLIEHGAPNRAWLRGQVACMSPTWDPFWDVLCDRRPATYKPLPPATALAGRTDVCPGDIHTLLRRRWDVGTMFFVAESITRIRSEFAVAVRAFVRSLRSRAPFAAAFMTGSTGYAIAGVEFPAVPVEAGDVAAALKLVARDVDIHQIEGVTPVRTGVGMLLATGRAR